MRCTELIDKVIAVLIGAGLAFAIMGLVGCGEFPAPTQPKRLYWRSIESVEGHKYIVITSHAYGGVSIVHAAHCPCLTTTGGKP